MEAQGRVRQPAMSPVHPARLSSMAIEIGRAVAGRPGTLEP